MGDGERSYEYRFRAADGNYLWMHDNLRLIRDDQGAPLEVMGSLTDITDRKTIEKARQTLISRLQEAHDQLLQSENMASIGQLAAGIAHEINNPVGFVNSTMCSLQKYVTTLFNVIDAYQEAVAEQDQPLLQERMLQIAADADLEFLQDDAAELVRESMDGLRRVKDIVQALKDFSHVGESEWLVADLHHRLDSTLNIVANEIKYKATVVREYGPLPPVTCLASQLNQVFMNLLVNAGHAIRDQGVITIRTGIEGDWVWWPSATPAAARGWACRCTTAS
ncbi:MAG: PAS domain S-box protein [Pseudomonadota bacterium]